jgi:23S rRNA (guanosine2251-2'-O)-methyltransferase
MPAAPQPPKTTGYICGRNTVLAELESRPDRIYRIYVAENLAPDKRIGRIFELARENSLVVTKVPRQKLDQMLRDAYGDDLDEIRSERPERERRGPERSSKSPGGPRRPAGQSRQNDWEVVHQGVMASVLVKGLLEVSQLVDLCRPKIEQKEPCLVVMLDGVSDPRNVGAIIRSVDALGAQGLVIPKHRGAGLGPAVAKTASGAEAVVDIAMATNLSNAIEAFQEAGFWVCGAAVGEKSRAFDRVDYNMPTLLVLGSEGEGLSRLVAKHCDFLVNIPMAGQAVDSLNVSVAAGIVMYHITRRQRENYYQHQQSAAAAASSSES